MIYRCIDVSLLRNSASLHEIVDQWYASPSPDDIKRVFQEVDRTAFFKSFWSGLSSRARFNFLIETLQEKDTNQDLLVTGIQMLHKMHYHPSAKKLLTAYIESHPAYLFDNLSLIRIDRVTDVFTVLDRLPEEIIFQKFEMLEMLYTKGRGKSAAEFLEEMKPHINSSIGSVLFPVLEMQYKKKGMYEMIFSNFMHDPSFPLIKGVRAEWVPEGGVDAADAFQLAEHRLMIARNLYFKGTHDPGNITEEMVVSESEHILKRRSELRDTYLFKDREVVVLAGNELMSDAYGKKYGGRPLFGGDDLLDEVKRQGAKSVELFSPDKALILTPEMPEKLAGQVKESVSAVKEDGLEHIATSTGPLTIMMEGHGSPRGTLNLIGGYHSAMRGMEGEYCISGKDLASALNKRWRNIQQEIASGRLSIDDANAPVIITYMSCFSSNQIRLLYAYLLPGVPGPVCLGGSEFNQFMVGYDSIFGSTHTEEAILQIDRGGPATVGGVWDAPNILYDKSNRVGYVPMVQFDMNTLGPPDPNALHSVPMQIF